MPGYVYYFLGLCTLPVIFVIATAASAFLSKAGPYALYEHVIDDQGHSHDHAIKTAIPRFARSRIFESQKKRCVYGKVGKTPEKAYDDEVEYIVTNDFRAPGKTGSFWDKAVAILDERYQTGYIDKRGNTANERIAEAQLQRDSS